MPQIIAAVVAVAVVAVKVATVVATVVTIGKSIFGKKKSGKSPAQNDRLKVSLDANAPRKIVFGHTAFATDLRDQEDTNSQEFHHRFIVIAAHEVEAVEKIYFDDKLAWNGTVQGEFVGYLEVAIILEGSAGNAINISPRMGSNRRYTGCAYIHFRHKTTGLSKKKTSPFANSIPTRLTIEGKGYKTYDPRLDSTRGGVGPMRIDDQNTWTYSETSSRNPAIQLLNYYIGWRINGLLSVGKGILPERIDIASFIEAANICDEPIPLAGGGTEPRYRADGVFSESDGMETVASTLKDCMNGEVDDSDGRIRLTIIHDDLATALAADRLFTENDILGAVKWTTSDESSFNIIRGTHPDPSEKALYQQIEYPELPALPSPDGIDRIDTFDLPYVQSHTQCQRLATLRRNRALFSGTLEFQGAHTWWRVQKNDVIRLSFPALGFVEKIFRVIEMDIAVTGIVSVKLREDDASIYVWAANEIAPSPLIGASIYNYEFDPNYLLISDIGTGGAVGTSYTLGLIGAASQANAGSNVTFTIPAHTRGYPYPYGVMAVNGGTVTGLTYATDYWIYYDDPALTGGAVTYQSTTTSGDAYYSNTNPFRHFIAHVLTMTSGGTGGVIDYV